MSDKKSVLTKEITLKKENYPTKRTMNFVVDKEAQNNKISLICFGIFLVFLVLFTKFGVIDSITKTNILESNYNSSNSALNTLREELSDYDEVEEQYDTLVGSFLTDEEKSSLNRLDLVRMIDEDVLPYVDVTNFSITGNTITVYTGVTDLNTISRVVTILQEDSRTQYVTVNRALAKTEESTKVTADIEITCVNLEGGEN